MKIRDNVHKFKTQSIELPELPRGKEFEEFISAIFHSSGFYVERNIIEKDGQDILELDIVLTNYNESHPDIRLVEIKSGDWGSSDLFKLYGWMNYLKYSSSVFIARRKRDNVDFIKKKFGELGIELILIPDLSKSEEELAELTGKRNIERADSTTWRCSYWVERRLLEDLKQKKKLESHAKCYKTLEDYYDEVNNGIFFTQDPIKRVETLYGAFHQKYPHISAKCGNEMVGKNFDDEYEEIPKEIFSKTFYDGNYNDIQISAFIEHRARLAILKSLVDYKMLGKESSSLSFLLPGTFLQGLDSIGKDKYFQKYPVFWQWFMWVFGGFILTDYKDEEYGFLARKTGIPIDEIQNALDSYNKLFPIEGGWFSKVHKSNIELLKIFPLPFAGIGAHYRKLIHTRAKKFDDLILEGKYTLSDLKKWNNLTVRLLNK